MDIQEALKRPIKVLSNYRIIYNAIKTQYNCQFDRICWIKQSRWNNMKQQRKESLITTLVQCKYKVHISFMFLMR